MNAEIASLLGISEDTFVKGYLFWYDGYSYCLLGRAFTDLTDSETGLLLSINEDSITIALDGDCNDHHFVITIRKEAFIKLITPFACACGNSLHGSIQTCADCAAMICF